MDKEFTEDELINITAGVNPSNTTHIENQRAIIAGLSKEEAIEKYKNNEITTDVLASVLGEEHEIVKAAREFEALDGTVNLMNDIQSAGLGKN